MVTPAWVITGLLDSGKTTLMNRLISEKLEDQEILLIQFENGDVPPVENEHIRLLPYSKSQLEEIPFEIAESICECLSDTPVDLVLIEWNGMEHFHKLEEMLLQFSVKPLLSIEKVIYTADEEGLAYRIADAGTISMSQAAASDCAYIRTGEHNSLSGGAEILFGINPDIHVYNNKKWEHFAKKLFHYELKPQSWILFVTVLTVFYLAADPILEQMGCSIKPFITVFLGVFLQAVPFLTIGVLLSCAIQIYIPPDWIQQKFPKKVIPGQLFAILAGFCIPVCDCASIPVFKSLIKKGVPMPAAVTFMLVSPIINPVVILSTWYAFNGNWNMIIARGGLGILCAVLSGLTFLFFGSNQILLSDEISGLTRSCTAYDTLSENGEEGSRFSKLMSHAQNEFFLVGKYLLTGIFVSTLFQDLVPDIIRSGAGFSLAGSILLMMGIAFVLSLCSSSDAVVARTMAGSLPIGALTGFLVFGPMMDLKNMAMLLSSFRKKFVARLMVTTFIICFTVVLIFAALGSGGIRI